MAGNGINSRQERAIEALLTSRTIGDAATASEVPERTLHRWLSEDSAFVKELADRRARLADHSFQRLTNSIDRAIDCLEGLLKAESEAVRRSAASDILTHGLKARAVTNAEKDRGEKMVFDILI